MKRIPVAEIKPGMIVAEDLIDMNGRTLLKKGAVMSDKYLEFVVKWGFEDIAIESEDEVPQGPPVVVGYQVFVREWDEIISEIDHQFALVQDKPLMAELKKSVIAHFKQIKESYSGRL